MTEVLILKTGALGDVLRTTSILPGLHQRYPDCRVTWFTAEGAVDLVSRHPLVAEVRAADPADPNAVRRAAEELAGTEWNRVLSFDDEVELCAAATRVGRLGTDGVLSGAYVDADGERRYTPDVAPWFDMGLLSVYGKAEADRRKIENTESHPAIFARMLGIEMGEPELPLPDEAHAYADAFAEETRLHERGCVIGLNTGAGGRWESKRLPVDRTVELVQELDRSLEGRCGFLLLGGPDEEARNAEIRARVSSTVLFVDAGTRNPLTLFAGLVDRLDLLVTSDSLAMHVGIARRIPVVAFFAPTSAAEIELYGRGEKVQSTAPDACTYRPDVDTSTLTVERLAAACLRTLRRTGRSSR